MGKRSKTAQFVYEQIKEMVEKEGVDLVDVEFVKEGPALFLRVYIDKPGGVDLDDCSKINQIVDPFIDHELQLTQHDYFEVSSPGLDRPLAETKDLLRHLNEMVEVRLYQQLNGMKIITGKLLKADDNLVAVQLLDKEENEIEIPRNAVAKISLYLDI